MKTVLSIILGLFVILQISNNADSKNLGVQAPKKFQQVDVKNLKSGDIIFQVTASSQCKAVQLATHSKYSHCGIIFKEENGWYVYEAVQPVQKTPLAEWISHGQKKHFVIKRIKEADRILTPDVVSKMQSKAIKNLGKNYDIYFEWSDDKIYCSELVWKIYHDVTGLEVGKLQKLRDFDLTSQAVKNKLKERYRETIPLDELVISPAAIFESNLVYTVQ